MAMNRIQHHIGIIYAGLGGLAAAIGIAQAGHRVTILEQAPLLGEVDDMLTMAEGEMVSVLWQ
jgi:salicylate hydroxylase